MRQIANALFSIYRYYKIKYEINEFDNYREKYNSLSFSDKKRIAHRWSKKYPEQAHFNYEHVDFWLRDIVNDSPKVLEIGGWKGDLALKALSSFMNIQFWHNYDIIESVQHQKCSDCRYKYIPLDDYIWHKSLEFEYNALIATHVIEHFNWSELVNLISWIPKNIETVLFEAPIPFKGENINWTGDHSTHILEKGWEKIISEMKGFGFEAVCRNDNTVIFKS